jgi:MinD superfamily P-loop ATPase
LRIIRSDIIKQLTIISGKGGTGKTSFTAAFAALAKYAVFADCDVDAADLHLIMKPEIKKSMKFSGLKMAVLDKEKCTECGECIRACRFGAISKNIEINSLDCEGCGVCVYVCSEEALYLVNRNSGEAFLSETRFGPMSHAKLNIAEEASGKLVTLVRNNARELAEKYHSKLIIIDGPPGIGCPVISSISGVDLVLIITEPTKSGIYDLKRILEVANHFGIPNAVCINKCDINYEQSDNIRRYCDTNGIPVVGYLPYDTKFTQAMIQGKTVNEFTNGQISEKIKGMWERIQNMML